MSLEEEFLSAQQRVNRLSRRPSDQDLLETLRSLQTGDDWGMSAATARADSISKGGPSGKPGSNARAYLGRKP
jgi:hypothetical protein